MKGGITPESHYSTTQSPPPSEPEFLSYVLFQFHILQGCRRGLAPVEQEPGRLLPGVTIYHLPIKLPLLDGNSRLFGHDPPAV